MMVDKQSIGCIFLCKSVGIVYKESDVLTVFFFAKLVILVL